jgi:hypothetical protein
MAVFICRAKTNLEKYTFIETQQYIYLFQTNTTMHYLPYWQHVSVTMPSVHKFKTGNM